MSIRTTIANKIIGLGRKIGRKSGKSELKVSVSNHDIKIAMADTDSDAHAWDHDLYKHGNLFYRDHANPIKINLTRGGIDLEDKDTVEAEQSDQADTDETEAEVMSSDRYLMNMRETLMRDLLNPTSNWKKLIYGLIGVGILQFLTIITVLASTGQF